MATMEHIHDGELIFYENSMILLLARIAAKLGSALSPLNFWLGVSTINLLVKIHG